MRWMRKTFPNVVCIYLVVTGLSYVTKEEVNWLIRLMGVRTISLSIHFVKPRSPAVFQGFACHSLESAS